MLQTEEKFNDNSLQNTQFVMSTAEWIKTLCRRCSTCHETPISNYD